MSRMPCTHKPHDHDNRDDRRRAVAGAIASNRIERLEPDAESLADLEEYVVGAISRRSGRTLRPSTSDLEDGKNGFQGSPIRLPVQGIIVCARSTFQVIQESQPSH